MNSFLKILVKVFIWPQLRFRNKNSASQNQKKNYFQWTSRRLISWSPWPPANFKLDILFFLRSYNFDYCNLIMVFLFSDNWHYILIFKFKKILKFIVFFQFIFSPSSIIVIPIILGIKSFKKFEHICKNN